MWQVKIRNCFFVMCYVDTVGKWKNPEVYTELIGKLEHNQKSLEVYIHYFMCELVILID